MILYATRQRVWILDDRNQTRKCDHAYVPDSTPIQLIIKWVIYQLFEYIAHSLSITLEKISTDHSISKKKNTKIGIESRFTCACCLHGCKGRTFRDRKRYDNRFFAALRRFIARQGISIDIYTDNGTNFCGFC